ncbi:hypothetical protein LUZ61_016530 [Rhynchospora tenuis]|uniref:Gnk2-homologous domain-containing protein n=1 Tax=Rhynchospora tenuis TaxID=198213 RepID=A0AAD5Z5Q2_9POAL|nr:hypothetical protein LUZ61_016530 [Rhynchospora tenuis]
MQIYCYVLLLTSQILLCNLLDCSGTIPGPFVSSCYNPNYTTGSTFDANLQHFLTDLPLKTLQNNYFYNATYGKAPDQVYGLSMCYADASSTACRSCLLEASTGIEAAGCAFKKTAVVWYDACMIRFSNEAFNASNSIGLEGCMAKVPDREPESLPQPNKFNDTLRQLVDGLSTKASRSPMRLAAGKMNYTSTKNIYVLVQCVRLFRSDECRMCIHDLTEFGVEACVQKNSVSGDETLTTVSCYVRFALRPFYVISEAHAPWRTDNIQNTGMYMHPSLSLLSKSQ